MVWAERRLAAALVVVVLGLSGVSAAGATETASVSVGFETSGVGRMIANSQTNPEDETWTWEACRSDLSSCEHFAGGRIVSTAGAPPMTVFRAISSRGASGLSPVWRGKLTKRKPPSVRKSLYANNLVTPVEAKWRGGWDEAGDLTQMSACRTRKGRECITLTDLHFPDACRHGGAVLDPVFTGWYLRVASWRVGPHPVMAMYAVGSPYGRAVWKSGRTVSVAVIGRIAEPKAARTNSCGAPPIDEELAAKLGI